MPPPEPKPRMNGEDVKLTFFIGGAPQAQSAIAKSISIKERATEHLDAFLGSDADDPDKQVRGYDASIESFLTDLAMHKLLLDMEKKRQLRQVVPELSIGLLYQNRDGTPEPFILQKCIAIVSINSSDAKERVMMSLDVKAKYYKAVVL